MLGLWTTILGILSGVAKLLSQALDFFKTNQILNQGKSLQQAEIAKEEILINREQTEILTQERKTEETIRRMEKGDF